MNRPFYAFALLLIMLTLAMLAVSSTSRWAMVRPPPAATKGHVPRHKYRPGGIYVIVLPAPPVELAGGLAVAHPSAKGVVPTRIELVRPELVATALLHIECWSHDDAICVRSGDRDEEAVTCPSCRTFLSVQPPPIDIDELLEVFHTFVPQQPPLVTQPSARFQRRVPHIAELSGTKWDRGASQSWLSIVQWRQIDGLRTLLLPVRNWLVRVVLEQGWIGVWLSPPTVARVPATRPMEWSDYADLMDHVASREATAASEAVADANSAPVRSGRWLLHFAAASLNRAGVTLRAAASELERRCREQSAPESNGLAR